MEVFRRHASWVAGSNAVAEIILPSGQTSRATSVSQEQ
jgi:hypothetical protein